MDAITESAHAVPDLVTVGPVPDGAPAVAQALNNTVASVPIATRTRRASGDVRALTN
jgi:hypothetical protein